MQWFSITAGALLLGSQLWHQVAAEQLREEAVKAFAKAEASPIDFTPDQSLWSEGRIAKWQHGQANQEQVAKAVLYLPASDTPIPIFGGTSEAVLDIGAGHLESTPMPGDTGNFAIAAHRDGYFRPLKDIVGGELIRVTTSQGDLHYRVSSTQIVEPTDVSVLAQTEEGTITLITCYPFYFVGSAPQRFIVQGTRVEIDDPMQISATSESPGGGSGG